TLYPKRRYQQYGTSWFSKELRSSAPTRNRAVFARFWLSWRNSVAPPVLLRCGLRPLRTSCSRRCPLTSQGKCARPCTRAQRVSLSRSVRSIRIEAVARLSSESRGQRVHFALSRQGGARRICSYLWVSRGWSLSTLPEAASAGCLHARWARGVPGKYS